MAVLAPRIGGGPVSTKSHESPEFRFGSVVRGRLAVGQAPINDGHVDYLKSQGIRAVLSLCGEEEVPIPRGLSSEFSHARFPLPDHRSRRAPEVLQIEQCLVTLEGLMQNGPVYVHCLAGIERSPLMCLAWLVRHLNMPLIEAHSYLDDTYSFTDLQPYQLSPLLRWSCLDPHPLRADVLQGKQVRPHHPKPHPSTVQPKETGQEKICLPRQKDHQNLVPWKVNGKNVFRRSKVEQPRRNRGEKRFINDPSPLFKSNAISSENSYRSLQSCRPGYLRASEGESSSIGLNDLRADRGVFSAISRLERYKIDLKLGAVALPRRSGSVCFQLSQPLSEGFIGNYVSKSSLSLCLIECALGRDLLTSLFLYVLPGNSEVYRLGLVPPQLPSLLDKSKVDDGQSAKISVKGKGSTCLLKNRFRLHPRKMPISKPLGSTKRKSKSMSDAKLSSAIYLAIDWLLSSMR